MGRLLTEEELEIVAGTVYQGEIISTGSQSGGHDNDEDDEDWDDDEEDEDDEDDEDQDEDEDEDTDPEEFTLNLQEFYQLFMADPTVDGVVIPPNAVLRDSDGNVLFETGDEFGIYQGPDSDDIDDIPDDLEGGTIETEHGDIYHIPDGGNV